LAIWKKKLKTKGNYYELQREDFCLSPCDFQESYKLYFKVHKLVNTESRAFFAMTSYS